MKFMIGSPSAKIPNSSRDVAKVIARFQELINGEAEPVFGGAMLDLTSLRYPN
jgi:hypothetical protein